MKKLRLAVMALVAPAFIAVYPCLGGAAQAQAQQAPRREKKPAVEDQIEQLRQQLQSQIDELKQELAGKDEQLQQAQQAAAAAQSAADKAQAAANDQQQAVSQNASAVGTLQSSVNELKSSSSTLQSNFETVQTEQKNEVKKSELSDLAFGHVKIGGLFYGDFVHYTDSGFGPQFLTQMNQTGPGNGGFNSFDITRTYLNFFYEPNGAITLRITPNIYRQVNGTAGATADGKNAQIGTSENGNLSFRLKYGYIQLNELFKNSTAFKKDVVRFGQTMNPLVDWEEALYGYRFVNLVPWNYLSLSSTHVGAEINGPIEVNGKEYLDYQIGAFNDTSFHHIEQSDTKQVMGRLTWYPFGTTVDRTGFGLTGFNAYGYNNQFPDTKSAPTDTLAVVGAYQSRDMGYEIAGEYDFGHNAFSSGTLFSGAGPTSTGTYATWGSMASGILSGTHVRQQGYDFFGHARLGKSKYKLFGMYEQFQPNTNLAGTDPLDFRRTVGGISYQYNKYLTVAFDDQNLTYYQGQFTMTPAQIATFNPSLATANPNGIPNAVPDSTNGIFMNVQFSY